MEEDLVKLDALFDSIIDEIQHPEKAGTFVNPFAKQEIGEIAGLSQAVAVASVRISHDGMTAYANVMSKNENHKPYTADDVMRAASASGVFYGIDEEAVKSMAERQIINTDVVIASGIKPAPGTDGKAKIKFDVSENKPVPNVESGAEICHLVTPHAGRDGKDVFGHVVPAVQGKTVDFVTGDGIVKKGNRFYAEYGGETLKNFGAIETPDDELYADATINVNGEDFVEIKALVYNKTAFPARVTDNLKLCYFFDISEIKAAGGSADDLVVTTNYMQGGNASDVLCWNDAKNLYYVAIDFTGTDIYPGSQDAYKKEVQFRIRNTKGVWDNSNDPSFIDVASVPSGTLTKALNMALYEGDKLVFGTEPNESNTGDAIKDIKPAANAGNNGGNSGNGGGYTGSGTANTSPAVQISDKGTVSVSLEQQQASGKGNTISFSLKITNTGDTGIDLSKLTADYFFTNDGGGDIVFECDYADIQGSSYRACTDTISGSFSKASGDKADTKCTIKSSGTLAGGDTLTVNVRIHKSDWTDFDLGNDLSGANADKITVTYNGKKL